MATKNTSKTTKTAPKATTKKTATKKTPATAAVPEPVNVNTAAPQVAPVVEAVAAVETAPLEALEEGATLATTPPTGPTGAKKRGKATKDATTGEAGKVEGEKMSGLDAAAKVLAENGAPMSCKAILEKMLAQGLWTTNGKTPAATLYSAMLREIDGKPGESRFVKTGRGLFGLTSTT